MWQVFGHILKRAIEKCSISDARRTSEMACSVMSRTSEIPCSVTWILFVFVWVLSGWQLRSHLNQDGREKRSTSGQLLEARTDLNQAVPLCLANPLRRNVWKSLYGPHMSHIDLTTKYWVDSRAILDVCVPGLLQNGRRLLKNVGRLDVVKKCV